MKKRGHHSIALVTIAVLALSSAAYGFFNSKGQGHASDVTGSMLPVTVAATTGGDSPSLQLQPGSSADVILRIANPNPHAVTLFQVTGNGLITSSGGIGACTTSGVTFTTQNNLSITIAASTTSLVHLATAASMSTASSSGCQGATFSIPVSIVVHEP